MQVVALNWRGLAHPQAGGSEVLVDHLLQGLQRRGHDVALICGGPTGTRPYPVIDAGGTYSQYLRAPLACATRFPHADVVIDVENGLPYFTPLWRRGASICLVHHVHVDQWRTRFPPVVASMGRWAEQSLMPRLYRGHIFVAVSRSTADALEAIGVDAARIRVIEPGVDVPPGATWTESDEPLFISLSRLVPHKRVSVLLEAWRLAQPTLGGRFVVAGDGPEFGALRDRAASIPGADVVGHIGEAEKSSLLARAWLLVHGASHEGWGLSILEAAAVGTPTLAANAFGVRDAIEDGVTGLLVTATDAELAEALAKSWIEIASDGERRRAMGEAARTRAETFTWERSVEHWIAVLDEATSTERSLARRKRHGDGQLGPVARGTVPTSARDAGPSRSADHGVGGLRRSLDLFQGFRRQFDDPDGFYARLADDTVANVERYHPLRGERVVDVGGGPGYFAESFRRAGASSVFVEPFWDEMTPPGRALGFGIQADGLALPFRDGTFDVAHSSNVIEHVTDPRRFFDELIRVVRPGGTVFLAYTNWLSPFGGHETSPWHYAGGARAARRYERRLGYPPKNQFGTSLFPLNIGTVLSWARHCPDAELLDAFPRYYPRWTKGLVGVPGVREFATWNLALVLRRR